MHDMKGGVLKNMAKYNIGDEGHEWSKHVDLQVAYL